MAIVQLGSHNFFLRVIDNSFGTNRANIFMELLSTLKITVLGLKTVTTGFNALLEKKDAAARLSDRGLKLLNTLNLTVKVSHQNQGENITFCLTCGP